MHRLNPAAKLGALALVAAGATLSFDPFIPGALALGLWLVSWLLGRVPLRRMLRWTVPLLVLPLPLAAFTALYADLSGVPDPQVFWRWGLWSLAWEGVRSGIGVGLRVTCFLATSLLFLSTTDPADLAISLIQNLRIPYRFGYGVLISFRFLPQLRMEFDTIRLAHRVRGAGRRAGPRGALDQLRRYAIPLLAAALRKSERTALAMDAKAFGSGPQRTYFRQMRVGRRDLFFLLGAAAYTLAVYWLALRTGLADLQWIPDV
jgi:energy-coupling factor transport system permease protein